MPDVLTAYQQIHRRLMVLCISPFAANNQHLRTTIWNTVYTFTVIGAYEIVLWFVVYSELLKFNVTAYSMVELLLNVAAVAMASCFPMTALFGYFSRHNQIALLQSIAKRDAEFSVDHVEVAGHCRRALRKFNRTFYSFITFKLLALLATMIMLGNRISLCIFFVCYSVSDSVFSIYVSYVCFCGGLVATRYESFIRRLQRFSENATTNRRRGEAFVGFLREIDVLHGLKKHLYKTFGSVMLFTIFFTSISLAIGVYGVIIAFDRTQSGWVILITVLFYALWMCSYVMRMVALGHVYEIFGRQVYYTFDMQRYTGKNNS